MSKSVPRILFLTAPIGAGHVRAAQAVRDTFAAEFPASQTEIVDVFGFFPAWIGRTVISTYLGVLRRFPSLYGKAYGWGNHSPLALWGREVINRLLAARCKTHVDRFSPDIIVCTHATPAGLAAYLVRKGSVRVPIVGIVTDFAIHRLWVYPELSCYFVAHERLREDLFALGIPREKSLAAGIPASPAFSRPGDRESLRRQLGLDQEAPCVLIMGGGLGVLPMDDIVRCLDQLPGPLQLVVVTGSNARQLQAVSELPTRHPRKVYGYIQTVHELMACADIMITKPGGMSVAEALTEKLPLVIYQPLPGVEQANTAFLIEQGAAETASSPEQIASLLATALVSGSLNRRKEAARALGRPSAARDIAAYIMKKYIL